MSVVTTGQRTIPSDGLAPAVTADCLLVWLGDEPFAFLLDDVAEVHQIVAATPAGDASGGLAGYIDIRGRAVPAVDLRRVLDRPARPWDPSMHLVVATTPAGTVAVAVDRIEDIVSAVAGEPTGSIGAAWIRSLVRVEPIGLVPLLDAEALLASAAGARDADAAPSEES